MSLSEVLLVLLLFILLAQLIRSQRQNTYPATSLDWFIEVQSDATTKKVTLTFYPVLAFKIKDGRCYPITSRPEVTDKLFEAGHAAGGDQATQTSETYGRWFRHGFRYNNFGDLCWSGLHFWVMTKAYGAANFQVIAINTPPEYNDWISPAINSPI